MTGTSASVDMMFSVKPKGSIARNVLMSDVGMANNTMIVLRNV